MSDRPEGEIRRSYLDRRFASQRARAARGIDDHERNDRRLLGFAAAVVVAVVGAIATLGKAIVDNSGETARRERRLTDDRLDALEARTRELGAEISELKRLRSEDREDFRRRIAARPLQRNPDLITSRAPPR